MHAFPPFLSRARSFFYLPPAVEERGRGRALDAAAYSSSADLSRGAGLLQRLHQQQKQTVALFATVVCPLPEPRCQFFSCLDTHTNIPGGGLHEVLRMYVCPVALASGTPPLVVASSREGEGGRGGRSCSRRAFALHAFFRVGVWSVQCKESCMHHRFFIFMQHTVRLHCCHTLYRVHRWTCLTKQRHAQRATGKGSMF